MINCRSYQPYSQGMVERAHLTIKKNLTIKFIEDMNVFNIDEKFKIVCSNYNKTKHSAIKYTPYEVFLVLILSFS